ncbi:uncharacterized protein LOC120129966 [Hibiscus syriacus]|uniref:uncharacterized protein LOC120129966 n=1 Tax=Hibiscus syriacus TaxID=106335 RepID=UPI0019208E86|nr:uncharacterized protein LOC120129966 [Hibiscus syriacus]
MADALATLDAMFKANKKKYMIPIRIQVYETPTHCYLLEEEMDGHPWYHDILQYMRYHTYPPSASEIDKKIIRRMKAEYFLDGEALYRKGSGQVLLRCVTAKETKSLMEEVHCGTHTNGLSMTRKIMRPTDGRFRSLMVGLVSSEDVGSTNVDRVQYWRLHWSELRRRGGGS